MSIYNESGILKKNGRGFHNPGEFATQNLYYVLWSNRYLCDENYSVSRDYFDSFSLIYVLEGKMGFLYDDRQIIVEHGEAILLDFRSKHYYRSLSEKLDKWEMLFKGSASEAYYRLLSECGKNVFRVKGQTQNVLEKIMGELDKQVPEEHTVSALIHTMLACVAEGRTNGLSDPVQKALAYMDSHLEQPLQIHEVAENIGLSRSYFSRLFPFTGSGISVNRGDFFKNIGIYWTVLLPSLLLLIPRVYDFWVNRRNRVVFNIIWIIVSSGLGVAVFRKREIHC